MQLFIYFIFKQQELQYLTPKVHVQELNLITSLVLCIDLLFSYFTSFQVCIVTEFIDNAFNFKYSLGCASQTVSLEIVTEIQNRNTKQFMEKNHIVNICQ